MKYFVELSERRAVQSGKLYPVDKSTDTFVNDFQIELRLPVWEDDSGYTVNP